MIGTTLGLIALGVAGTGVAMSAVGQVKAGNAAQRAGNFNAAALEAQADDAIKLGETEVGRFRQQVKQLIGSQRVGFASQNVEVGSGSALDVVKDAQYLADLDIAQIRENAQREAWGLRTAAQGERMGASAAASAGRWGAASTALGGGGSLLMTAYGWQRAGR